MLIIIRNYLLWVSRRFNIIAYLTAENLALRQQLIVLKRNQNRPNLKVRDRLLWKVLSQTWSGWRSALLIVQPDTVVRWHKSAFKLYWKFKSRGSKRGRPPLDPELKALVFKLANANPLWGAPKIHGELAKLGIELSERTVSGLLRQRNPKPPSQTWRTFLKNHMTDTVAVDFLVIPTIRFQFLFVFVVLNHDRRRVVHFNVTANPTAKWTAQQIIEAFPWDTAPRYLLRDNDNIYGESFQSRVRSMDIEEIPTAYRSPWQNPYVERLNGSIRRECTDHIIAWNKRHLTRTLRKYFDYYNNDRTHLGLDKETPIGRSISRRNSPSDRISRVTSCRWASSSLRVA